MIKLLIGCGPVTSLYFKTEGKSSYCGRGGELRLYLGSYRLKYFIFGFRLWVHRDGCGLSIRPPQRLKQGIRTSLVLSRSFK